MKKIHHKRNQFYRLVVGGYPVWPDRIVDFDFDYSKPNKNQYINIGKC